MIIEKVFFIMDLRVIARVLGHHVIDVSSLILVH